jgi:hypothetical protein
MDFDSFLLPKEEFTNLDVADYFDHRDKTGRYLYSIVLAKKRGLKIELGNVGWDS